MAGCAERRPATARVPRSRLPGRWRPPMRTAPCISSLKPLSGKADSALNDDSPNEKQYHLRRRAGTSFAYPGCSDIDATEGHCNEADPFERPDRACADDDADRA